MTQAFLTGAERSGTTLLRLMLDHHPKISWRGESEFMVDYMPDGYDEASRRRMFEQLDENRIFREFDAEYGVPRAATTYQELARSWLDLFAARHPNEIVGATFHRNYDRVNQIWPYGNLIYLYRDGRDVARSRIGMGWEGNMWTAAYDWVRAEEDWGELKKILPNDRYLEVSYESLIENPVKELTNICAFLELPYSDRMLTYDQSTTYDKPDASLIAQWRTKLNDREIQLCEAVQSATLLNRDYELSGLPLKQLDRFKRFGLKVNSKVNTIRFRVRRKGLGLFVASFLTRRLGLSRWRPLVREMEHNVERKHLK